MPSIWTLPKIRDMLPVLLPLDPVLLLRSMLKLFQSILHGLFTLTYFNRLNVAMPHPSSYNLDNINNLSLFILCGLGSFKKISWKITSSTRKIEFWISRVS
jgi:hypothetical protein